MNKIIIERYKSLFDKYFSIISNCSLSKFIFIQLIIIIGFSITFKSILHFLSISIESNTFVTLFDNKPMFVKFILFIIMGPFLETIIFQYLPYQILANLLKGRNKKIIIIIISALLFSFTHWYGIFYFLYALVIGLILMFSYLSRLEKGDSFQAILIIHTLFNCIVFLERLV